MSGALRNLIGYKRIIINRHSQQCAYDADKTTLVNVVVLLILSIQIAKFVSNHLRHHI